MLSRSSPGIAQLEVKHLTVENVGTKEDLNVQPCPMLISNQPCSTFPNKNFTTDQISNLSFKSRQNYWPLAPLFGE
jgi:hypothetical protein